MGPKDRQQHLCPIDEDSLIQPKWSDDGETIISTYHITCNGEVIGKSSKTISSEFEEKNIEALFITEKQQQQIQADAVDEAPVTQDQYKSIDNNDLGSEFYTHSDTTVEGLPGSTGASTTEANATPDSAPSPVPGLKYCEAIYEAEIIYCNAYTDNGAHKYVSASVVTERAKLSDVATKKGY